MLTTILQSLEQERDKLNEAIAILSEISPANNDPLAGVSFARPKGMVKQRVSPRAFSIMELARLRSMDKPPSLANYPKLLKWFPGRTVGSITFKYYTLKKQDKR